MSTYRSKAADRRVEDDTHADRALMCSAHCCPSRWSVEGPAGRLCSRHAWSDPRLWPQITEELVQASAEAALRRAAAQGRPQHAAARQYRLTLAEKRALLHKAAGAFRGANFSGRREGRELAKRLLDWQAEGYRMTLAQRQFVEANLGAGAAGAAVRAEVDASSDAATAQPDELEAWAAAVLPEEVA